MLGAGARRGTVARAAGEARGAAAVAMPARAACATGARQELMTAGAPAGERRVGRKPLERREPREACRGTAAVEVQQARRSAEGGCSVEVQGGCRGFAGGVREVLWEVLRVGAAGRCIPERGADGPGAGRCAPALPGRPRGERSAPAAALPLVAPPCSAAFLGRVLGVAVAGGGTWALRSRAAGGTYSLRSWSCQVTLVLGAKYAASPRR